MVRQGESLTAEQVADGLQGQIAPFKIPELIVIVKDPLPRNASGKILKRELRETATNLSVADI